MRRHAFSATAFALIAFSARVLADDVTVTDPQRIAQLIEQLGSRSYQARSQAENALAKRCDPVTLDLLQHAASHKDREIRHRAAALYQRMKLRYDTDQRLQSQTIRLSYDKLPLSAVIQDFTKRTGLPFELDAAAQRAAVATVTLKTDAISQWDALDRICEQGGLTIRKPQLANTTQQPRVSASRNRAIIWVDEAHLRRMPAVEEKLILTPKANDLSASVNLEALRIQSWSGAGKSDDALLLSFELEKRLKWNHLVSLHLESAVDDLGQLRVAPEVHVDQASVIPDEAQEIIVVWDGHTRWPTDGAARQQQIRLLKGERPAKRIAELRGTLRARVTVPDELLLTIPDLCKTKRATLHAADGTALTITGARQATPDRFELVLEHYRNFAQLDLGIPINGKNVRIINRQQRGLRGVANGASTTTNENAQAIRNAGFTLLDARGREIKVLEGKRITQSIPGVAMAANGKHTYKLTIPLSNDQAAPKQLVYRGSLETVMVVPFTLKNVPLRR